MIAVTKLCVTTKLLSTRVVCPWPEVNIHVKRYKIFYIKSEIKMIFLKFTTNDQNEKGFHELE